MDEIESVSIFKFFFQCFNSSFRNSMVTFSILSAICFNGMMKSKQVWCENDNFLCFEMRAW